ncbi:MAG: TlpA family protein disulfide reductase [Gammaproteobacteria bacterium]|nr:TlpA family protein disulfide reductase [Gammaproteobacteria bacterium]
MNVCLRYHSEANERANRRSPRTNPALWLVLIGGMLSLLTLNTARAEAVDFSLPDMYGKMHKLSDYRGKWVVVNYWATWCPPCLSELPELVAFHEDHKDTDAVVLGVNFESISAKGLRQFSEEYFMNYPVLLSKPGPDSALGPIPGLPTTYLISPEGEIIARQVGEITAKLITDFIDQQGVPTEQPPSADQQAPSVE